MTNNRVVSVEQFSRNHPDLKLIPDMNLLILITFICTLAIISSSFFPPAQTRFFQRFLCFLPRLWFRGIETGARKAALFGGAKKSPHCSSTALRVSCREAGERRENSADH